MRFGTVLFDLDGTLIDSGSLILDRRTNTAVGLLFAGSATHTLANPIQSVLDALDVSFAP